MECLLDVQFVKFRRNRVVRSVVVERGSLPALNMKNMNAMDEMFDILTAIKAINNRSWKRALTVTDKPSAMHGQHNCDESTDKQTEGKSKSFFYGFWFNRLLARF